MKTQAKTQAHDINRLQLIIIANEVNSLKNISLTLFKVLQATQSYQSQTIGPKGSVLMKQLVLARREKAKLQEEHAILLLNQELTSLHFTHLH